MPTRRLWFFSPLLALGLLALAACSEDQTSGATPYADPPDYPVTWRFALEEIEGSVQHVYATAFKERIERLSEGRIEIDVFPYGSLGTSAQLTALAQDGSIQLAFASPGHLANTIPEVGIFTLHFVLPDNSEANREILASEQLLNVFRNAYAEQNMTLLGFVPEGWIAWTANKPLRSPQDFQGFRIRTTTADISAEAYRAYGAEPVATPYSQVYTDLKLQKIDGQANPLFAIEEMGFYEVQDTLTLARPAQFVTSVVSNHSWYNSLPPEQQQWLNSSVRHVGQRIYDTQDRLNQKRLDAMSRDSDIEIVELTEAERERFREASLQARSRYTEAAGERGQVILDTMLDMAEKYQSR